VGDAFQEGGLVVGHQRPASMCPPVPMHEAEIWRGDAVDERDVAANDGVFDLLFEREDLGGRVRAMLLRMHGTPYDRQRDDRQGSDAQTGERAWRHRLRRLWHDRDG